MDISRRNNLIDDLREIDTKLRIWLGAEDMNATDRQALESARGHIRNVCNRQLGNNYLGSRPFPH